MMGDLDPFSKVTGYKICKTLYSLSHPSVSRLDHHTHVTILTSLINHINASKESMMGDLDPVFKVIGQIVHKTLLALTPQCFEIGSP